MIMCVWEKRGRVCVCTRCGDSIRHDNPSECRGVCRGPSTTTTQLTESRWLHQCRNCDWTLEADSPEPVEHVCGRKEVVRLGDRVASALESVGITPETWSEFKEAHGLPPGCACPSRKAWLNRLDEKLELGEKLDAFKQFMGWG